MLRLFDHFSPGEDEIPSRANRHATAHTVDGVQYASPNALIATMLSVSILREIQESLTLAENEPATPELEAVSAGDGPTEEQMPGVPAEPLAP
ncbi:hypothetical protein ACGFIY_30535 [Micromonospora chersina]|uniref:hypothetical protein n=1 Tax=Micromonospora chersina TaxID=47854 RepID=UPI00371CF289